MRYQVRQRLMSLVTRLDIANEDGKTILQATGKAFTFSADITIRSLDGREFVRVRQRMLSWRSRFRVSRGGRQIASVSRDFTLRPCYTVALPGGERLAVRGSLFAGEYSFQSLGRVVAHVSRRMWSLRDTYGVEVLEPRLDAVVLATVVAIDAHRAQQSHAA